jgi:GAF domain/Sel1 repeat
MLFHRRDRGRHHSPMNRSVAARANLTVISNPERRPGSDSAEKPYDRLHFIAQNLILNTGADGAAIAVEENGEIVCRASAGDCAPSVGAIVEGESGLSGLCLRNGAVIRCDDAASDLRVNAEARGALGILSLVAFPLKRGDDTVGIVELLSRTPNAFGTKEEEILCSAATAVLDIVRSESSTANNYLQNLLQFAPRDRDRRAPDPAVAYTEDDRKHEHSAIDSTILEDQEAPNDLRNSATTNRSSGCAAGPQPALWASAEGVGIATLGPLHPPQAGYSSTVNSVAPLSLRLLLTILVLLLMFVAIVAGLWRFAGAGMRKQTAAGQRSSAESLPVANLRQASLSGDATAQYELAMRLLSGDGLPRSQSDAVTWLVKSAHQGNSSAQYQLGLAYEHGTGVQQDPVKAYACYILAGTKGNVQSNAALNALALNLSDQETAEARMLVGQMFKNAIGTPADTVQAYVWFALAAAAGSREGQQEMESITSKMKPGQIALAKRRAAEWLQQHAAPHRSPGE